MRGSFLQKLRGLWVPNRVAVCLVCCVPPPILSATDLSVLTIPAVTSPPGVLAQIRLELDLPRPIASGVFTVALPADVFGPIADVQMFSAAGDALGTATLNGNRAEVQFSSLSGGIGRIAGLPVATITAPILASAKIGTTASFRVEIDTWKDVVGTPLAIAVRTGQATVGGELSIQHVIPSGPETYRIEGTGFGSGTRISARGVPIASVSYLSPQEMEITLAGPTELTGRLLRAENPSGEAVEFAYALETKPGPLDDLPFRVFLPLRRQDSVDLGLNPAPLSGSKGIAIENPHLLAVEVTVEIFGTLASKRRFTIPPLSRLTAPSITSLGVPLRSGTGGLLASLPVRAAIVKQQLPFPPGPSPITVVEEGTGHTAFQQPEQPFTFSPESLLFVYRPGGALPPPQIVYPSIQRLLEPMPWTVTSSAPWLIVSNPTEFRLGSNLNVGVMPGSLPPGDYSGAISVTPGVPGTKPQTIPVTLGVRLQQFINLPASYSISSLLNGPAFTERFSVYFDAGPRPATPVQLRARVEVDGEGRWLSLVSDTGSTAEPLLLRVNPTGLAEGAYRARVIVTAPTNTATTPLTLHVYRDQSSPLTPAQGFHPSEVAVWLVAGESARTRMAVTLIGPIGYHPISVSTVDGVGWLSAVPILAGVGTSFEVIIDARSLSPGTYRGSVKVTLPNGSLPAELPVQVRIWSGESPGVVIAPTRLSLGGTVEAIEVTSQGDPVRVQATVETMPRGCLLSAVVVSSSQPPIFTPAKINVSCAGQPGRYEGTIRVNAGSRSELIPVSITIPARPFAGLVSPPVISAVTNGASNLMGPIAAGSLVTIHGVGKGRDVTFDGLPAEIVYESLFQTNVVVPAAVAGRSLSTLRVSGGGTATATLAVQPNAPGLFTRDGGGQGQGAILNEDGLLNSAEHPASPGSIVQIFATGLTTDRVRVTIGGEDATVLFAGEVPLAGLGLFQINAVVPAGATANAAASLLLWAGEVKAQEKVTIAVR